MNQLVIAKTCNCVWFMMQPGILSFWRRPENFVLYLVHRILNVTYTLDINLYILVHPEVSEQPQPSSLSLPIHPHSISCPSLFHYQRPGATLDIIVPLGVLFELSYSICNTLLSRVRFVATWILVPISLDETKLNFF